MLRVLLLLCNAPCLTLHFMILQNYVAKCESVVSALLKISIYLYIPIESVLLLSSLISFHLLELIFSQSKKKNLSTRVMSIHSEINRSPKQINNVYGFGITVILSEDLYPMGLTLSSSHPSPCVCPRSNKTHTHIRNNPIKPCCFIAAENKEPQKYRISFCHNFCRAPGKPNLLLMEFSFTDQPSPILQEFHPNHTYSLRSSDQPNPHLEEFQPTISLLFHRPIPHAHEQLLINPAYSCTASTLSWSILKQDRLMTKRF